MVATTQRPQGFFARSFSRISAGMRRRFSSEAEIVEPEAVGWPRPSFFPSDDIAVQGHAGARHDPSRSWLPAYVQDARYDITPGDRLELVRKARYFEQTNGLVQKVLDLIETNVVGAGIVPTPTTEDEAWNAQALAWWEEWSSLADVSSRQSIYALQAIMARTTALDGEIFVILTFGEDGRYPRIQLVETQRVTSATIPRDGREWETYYEFDGILFDQRGRPAYYCVSHDHDALSKARPEKVSMVPADRMVHVFEPSRAGQARGLTLFQAVLHDIHDLDDLQRYEMKASKDAASRTRTIYNEKGEAPSGDGTVVARGKKIPKDDGSQQDLTLHYTREYGAKTVYLRHGDKSELDEPMRPTAAQQAFWTILERKIARGVGLSYAAVLDYEGAWGGAALRGALVSDNRFYDVRTHNLMEPMHRIYRHVIGAGIAMGRLKNPPPNPARCKWQSPRRGTVDIGRESKAILDELRYGIRCERDVIGELGTDHKAIFSQRAAEVRARLVTARDLAKEFKVPTMTAYALLQEPPSGVYAAALADQEITDIPGARPGGATPPPA